MTEGRFLNILIGGEAGQGLQTVGTLFAKSFVRSGFSVHVTQTYESRVRGGHNTFSIRAGSEKVLAGQETIDILIALNEETVDLHRKKLTKHGLIIGDGEWKRKEKNWIGLPLKEFGEKIYWNTACVGVAAGLIGLDEKVVAKTIEDTFGKEHSEENWKILNVSYHWLKEQALEWEKLPANPKPAKRLMMTGHEAVALGALSAGLKFCAYYPMSPSTSIAQTLIDWAKDMDLVIEQAEDEIAAINMAIGASYAGAPSMVPTSGGGFALMVEAVSLAAITETPVVIVIGQRSGPATGLATRTEQGELGFVVHAGHGEFPRAVFAPGTIEECFHLTRKAFELAEKYQGPMFVLTDHFLADSYRDMERMDISKLSFIRPNDNSSSVKTPYLRYRITKNGISPRLLPGLSEHLVVVDSHEHMENGHMTENLFLRPKMVDKRLRKGDGIRSEVIPPDFQGDKKADLLLISWGSTRGAIEEAAVQLRAGKKKVATIHFSQVWPVVPDHFVKHLEQSKKVICVEGNATGQFAQLIRRETGFVVQKRISRYDGLPITPEYILRHLQM
ncbi:MAG: pyruvate ferredoxin oxidoreductase [Deltaproteobacteria bacterium RBG_13_52_11b]|nr:MAG: pyruvate ferredoxin oxidoreductase [Deltaproteobacteria bacterium RBG_13_52_11b]